MRFRYKRDLRTLKAIVQNLLRFVKVKYSDDNFVQKIKRIRKLQKQLSVDTLVETGTFYGQTVNYSKEFFNKVISIELYEPLYKYNLESFRNCPNVELYLGDSSYVLKQILKRNLGKCLFWLDGHYSGKGTGLGVKVSPIIEELRIIRNYCRHDSCILIDDYRLFGNDSGYPTFEDVKAEIKKINSEYNIIVDSDCIVAYVE